MESKMKLRDLLLLELIYEKSIHYGKNKTTLDILTFLSSQGMLVTDKVEEFIEEYEEDDSNYNGD
jgi:hypothetical protein